MGVKIGLYEEISVISGFPCLAQPNSTIRAFKLYEIAQLYLPFNFLENFKAVIRDMLFRKLFMKRMCHCIRIVDFRNDLFKQVVRIAGKQIINGRIQSEEIGAFDIVTVPNQFKQNDQIDDTVRKLQIHSRQMESADILMCRCHGVGIDFGNKRMIGSQAQPLIQDTARRSSIQSFNAHGTAPS